MAKKKVKKTTTTSKLSRATKSFITKAKKEHGNKYDYNGVIVSGRKPVKIGCKKHGSFRISPTDHLRGKGCYDCSESKGERKVRCYLESKKVNFSQEHIFEDLMDKKHLRYDFFVPSKNLLIEYHGKQHYEAVEHFGGEKVLLETQRRDKMKKDYALERGYQLVEIPYTASTTEHVRKILMRYL